MARRQWNKDELAYNGDPNPKRMGTLTPRQRDIVTRVLQDVKYAMLRPARERLTDPTQGLEVRYTDLDALCFGPCPECGQTHNGVRMDLEEIELLIDAMNKINPRRDD